MKTDAELMVDIKQPYILFLKFLKVRGLFFRLYDKQAKSMPSIKQYKDRWGCASDLWMMFSVCIMERPFDNGQYTKKLQYSQLWRFFLLDNVDFIKFINEECKESFISGIKSDIRENGTRYSEEIKKYFVKYSIKND